MAQPIPGAGPGAYNPGFSPQDTLYHSTHAGEPYVWSGYWGKNVYASELPAHESAAYGFAQPGQGGVPGGMMGGAGGAPMSTYGPGKTGGGGFGAPGGSGYSGAFSYASQNNPMDYANAASNAIAQMYKRIRERSATGVNTDLAKRGIFSSGVAGGIMGEKMHELDLNETADIAKLYQQQGSSGGGGIGGGNPSQGGIGPWNMGGFGSALPGFLPAPGSGPIDQSVGYPQIKEEARKTQKANGNNSGSRFGGFGGGGVIPPGYR